MIEPQGLQDYLAILKRRKWHIAIPAIGLFALSAAVAFLWPPVYRSSATILMEEPDVPRDLVSSTVTSFASQRVQVITQRIMARRNLVEIIEKYDLYPEDREKQPIGLVA